MMVAPIIYNLFPRLAGTMDHWPRYCRRAAEMGFNWIYLNPLHYPGFSGSLYAVKDYYRVNPAFLPQGETGDGMEMLRSVLADIKSMGLKVMMDLVINHTAIDCPLVEEHPHWYKVDENGEVLRPFAIDPADSRKVTVWGDLGEIDNLNKQDRQGLWNFWRELVESSLELGFDGFRCDAAYKVPTELWEYLIQAAQRINPNCAFFAETLGCTFEEVEAVASSGFQYLFNSVKWWNFDEPWAVEQHEAHRNIAPSVAFPESHDTARLTSETDGLPQVQKQRYAVAAAFSEGLLMPIGYEYGHKKKLDVVHTTPDDWQEPAMDLTAFIRRVNTLKLKIPLLGSEGALRVIGSLSERSLLLEKSNPAGKGEDEKIVIMINKDWHRECDVSLSAHFHSLMPPLQLYRICVDGPTDDDERIFSGHEVIRLNPAEVAYLSHPIVSE